LARERQTGEFAAHRLFFAQVEYCDNLIFRRRASVDALEQQLLDANRTIGQPNKLTLIFGRRITRFHGGKLQTVIEDLNLPNPVIRSHYRKGSSSDTSAIVSSCARKRRPAISPAMTILVNE
jgi:hypothetical protein